MVPFLSTHSRRKGAKTCAADDLGVAFHADDKTSLGGPVCAPPPLGVPNVAKFLSTQRFLTPSLTLVEFMNALNIPPMLNDLLGMQSNTRMQLY